MEWFQAQRVRNLTLIQLEPSKNLNIFTGENASGKTAILESIFLLSRGKSFRTPRIHEVIQYGNEALLASCQLQHEHEGTVNTAIEKRYGNVTIKRNGEKIRTISEQASILPVILITQQSHQIVSGTPKDRRHWLDWAMFHVEPAYLDHWKRYMRALRHRNILLKKKEKNNQLYESWEQIMVETGRFINDKRKDFLLGLNERIASDRENPVISGVKIDVFPGWKPGEEFNEGLLARKRPEDIERGFTRTGIHQADVQFTRQERKISATYSNGQIKLFSTNLLFAQAKETERRTGVKSIIIVDDYRAELDNKGSKYILSKLLTEGFQAFVSTTELEAGLELDGKSKQFHVEHGKISNISRI